MTIEKYKFPYGDPSTEKEIKEFVSAAKQMIEDAKKTATVDGLEVADLIVRTAVGVAPKFSSEKGNFWADANKATISDPKFLSALKPKENNLGEFIRSPLNPANVMSTVIQLGLLDDVFKEGENFISYKDLMNHVVVRQLANLFALLYKKNFESVENVVTETKTTFFRGHIRSREDVLNELGEEMIEKGWHNVFVTLYTGKPHERPEVLFTLYLVGSIAALTHGKELGIVKEKELKAVEKAKEEGVIYAIQEDGKLPVFMIASNAEKLFKRLGLVIGYNLTSSEEFTYTTLPPLLSEKLINDKKVTLAFIKGLEQGRQKAGSTEGMVLELDENGLVKTARTGMAGAIENSIIKIGDDKTVKVTTKSQNDEQIRQKQGGSKFVL